MMQSYRSFLFICCVLIFLTLKAGAQCRTGETIEASGTTGSLVWTFCSDGTLYISGTGEMPNYGSSNYPWYPHSGSITDLVIGEGVKNIGTCAFYYCVSLKSVSMAGSVTSIGGWSFFGCSSLPALTINNTVTSIGDGAFFFCSDLTFVSISASVKSIGNDVFEYCEKLSEFIVADDNSEYASIDGVLFNKDKTRLIKYPEGKTSVGYNIPSSVTTIGNSAFRGCYTLTAITIPNSVTEIKDHVFNGCYGLTAVVLPDSLISIGRSAFSSCLGLKSVFIPESVTAIADWAFSDCTGITSLTIPHSLTAIGDWAFYNCRNLAEIINHRTSPQPIQANVFDQVDKANCTLFVPASSLDSYRNHSTWGKDFKIKEIEVLGIE